MERDPYLSSIAPLDKNTGGQEVLGSSSRKAYKVQLSEGVNNTLQPARPRLTTWSICSYLWLEDIFSFLLWEEL